MKLVSISLRNLRVRALSSALTTVSIAIGTLLLSALWLLLDETEAQYQYGAQGYGAIVGPKEGSPMDLVLNTVYSLGLSQGHVPFRVYRELHDGEGQIEGTSRRINMMYVIPQARGDTYKQFHIVGTTDEMFSQFFYKGESRDPSTHQHLDLREGRYFTFGHEQFVEFADEYARKRASGEAEDEDHDHDHDHSHGSHSHGDTIHFGPENEAVIGYQVAHDLGLRIGDPITPTHGSADDPGAHVHMESACQVVGILERTGMPVDRMIYIPISTFLSMEGHDAIRDTESQTADSVGLSAIICRGRRYNDNQNLRWAFQGRRDAQAAVAHWEVTRILEIVGNATRVLDVTSWLVLVVAAVSVLVALYNTMNERRREIAIMRSLGARRSQILTIVVAEATLIAFGGALLGIVGCHLSVFGLAGWVADTTGVLLDWTAFSMREVWLILFVTALGGIAGVLPAIKGARTEVAANLGPIS
ncbi:MAG: ABC transporter permease [Planctomycetes bacterium]|nr:ABC transporter permease [Planctomycetota bacterium]